MNILELSIKNIIELKNTTITLGSKQIFSDLSFSLERGSKKLILGQNGSGKTTFLRALIGNISLNNGSVNYAFELQEINDNLSWLSASNLGLYDRLTGLENINFISSLLKEKNDLVQENIQLFSELKPFRDALKTPTYLCSSGMKQILRIFIMLMGNAKNLIWDEPFRTLDQNTISFLYERYWLNSDYTIVYTSHITNDLDGVSQVYEIKEGKLVS